MLDIPLLFEGWGDRRVDATRGCSTGVPAARPSWRAWHDGDRLAGILRQQVLDARSRVKGDRHSDGLGLAPTRPALAGAGADSEAAGSRLAGQPVAREIHSPACASAAKVGYKQRMREIVLDTETTGLDPLAGHRVVEVGCIELVDTVATGKTFHAYFNPEMIMPTGAQDIHGLTDEFLSDKPLFADKVEEFLAFIGDAQLVIHNAQFDLGFLNAELERLDRPQLANSYVDTVSMARRKFPGQRASLDALCERFSIDNSSRTKHGALLDSELLAEVYLELSGGRQRDLGLAPEIAAQAVAGVSGRHRSAGPAGAAACRQRRRARGAR